MFSIFKLNKTKLFQTVKKAKIFTHSWQTSITRDEKRCKIDFKIAWRFQIPIPNTQVFSKNNWLKINDSSNAIEADSALFNETNIINHLPRRLSDIITYNYTASQFKPSEYLFYAHKWISFVYRFQFDPSSGALYQFASHHSILWYQCLLFWV